MEVNIHDCDVRVSAVYEKWEGTGLIISDVELLECVW
jgi:hypothetical protein